VVNKRLPLNSLLVKRHAAKEVLGVSQIISSSTHDLPILSHSAKSRIIQNNKDI